MNGVFHMHPPKTGGTSLISALMEHTNFKDKYAHLYKSNLYDHINPFNCDIQDDFVTLGVRDPYDRYLSLSQWVDIQQVMSVSGVMDVKFFIKWRKQLYKLSANELKQLPHKNWLWALRSNLCEWEDQVIANHDVKLIRFESYNEDVKRVYPNLELPHIHKKANPGLDFVQLNFSTQEILNKFNEQNSADFERYQYPMFMHLDDLYQNFLTK